MEIDGRVIGVAAALGSAASWAVGAILFKRLGERLSPMAMTLAKGTISVVLLGVVMLAVGMQRMETRDLLIFVASGLVGITIGDSFFFAALQFLGPAALVVLLMVGQVLTVLLALIFLQETPSPIAWAGIACVVGGVGIVLSGTFSGERSPSALKGIVLGLASVVCMSVSVIIIKKSLDSSSAMQATFIRMAAGTVGMAIYGGLAGQLTRWTTAFRDFRFAGHFVVAVSVITFGGFWLSLLAIKCVDVWIANTLISTEPIFVLPLAAIFLREKITTRAVIGTVAAVLGVILICAT